MFSMQAGVPDGVVNVVNGYGSVAGAALTFHMDVDKVIASSTLDIVLIIANIWIHIVESKLNGYTLVRSLGMFHRMDRGRAFSNEGCSNEQLRIIIIIIIILIRD